MTGTPRKTEMRFFDYAPGIVAGRLLDGRKVKARQPPKIDFSDYTPRCLFCSKPRPDMGACYKCMRSFQVFDLDLMQAGFAQNVLAKKWRTKLIEGIDYEENEPSRPDSNWWVPLHIPSGGPNGVLRSKCDDPGAI